MTVKIPISNHNVSRVHLLLVSCLLKDAHPNVRFIFAKIHLNRPLRIFVPQIYFDIFHELVSACITISFYFDESGVVIDTHLLNIYTVYKQ